MPYSRARARAAIDEQAFWTGGFFTFLAPLLSCFI
jgi:hypothetical protein